MLTNKRLFLIIFTLSILFINNTFGQTDVCLYDVTQKEIEADIVGTQTYTFNVTSTSNVAAGSMIVEFDTHHPRKQQFKAVITHPNGTTSVTIADLTQSFQLGSTDGLSYGSPNAKYVIFDAAASNMNNAGDALPGNYKPQAGTFSTFDGMAANGTWTISFTDKDGSFDYRGYVRNVYLKFNLASGCSAPATPASGLTISNVSSYSADLSWTNNSGDNVVVIARKSSDGAIVPESGESYNANSIFGFGQELRTIDNDCDYSGNFVVYKGSGSSVTVTGLTSGLTYAFDIYAATGTCFNTTALTGTQLLPCPSSSDPPFALPAKFRTCGSVSGTEVSDAGSLSFDIEVSGLTEPLAASTNNLRQVKVYFKNGTNENLSLYSCTLTSPTAKTSSVIFTTGSFATSVPSAQVTFRESSRLNPPSSSAVIPYDIGLYRIQTAEDFTTKFDGLANPNGTWTITFTETAGSTVDDLQIDYIELEFGPSYLETDISNFGKNCSNAYELLLGNYLSSNSESDTDDGNQPTRHTSCGNGIAGCGCWNASYNEAQYLKFTATSTYFSMSVSGIQASSGDIQVIMVKGNPTPCSGSGNWTVMTCPESSFDNTPNSLDGRSHTGNGSIQNFDLSMDNAVIGNVYYIIIDGNMSATANYYINVTDGVASSSTLPISLISFDANYVNDAIELTWETASELNNNYFTIEKSSNAIDFKEIGKINGAGNSNEVLGYNYWDYSLIEEVSYYRLKQTDYDGQYSYSPILSVSKQKKPTEYNIDFYYSQSDNSFILEFVAYNKGDYNLEILNQMAQVSNSYSGSFEQGYNKLSFKADNYSPGINLMKFSVNGKFYSAKTIVY